MVVEIYSTPSCSNCVMAKNLLNSKSIPYTEYTVGTDVEKSVIEELCNCIVKSVPQIFIDKVHLGGLKELQAVISDIK